jgi:methylmalonyl-CoA/ethylmalonyl-CoA epimerase
MPLPALPDFAADHFSVSVPDLETAIAWYSDIFGFTVEARFEIDAIPAKAAFLRSPALRLELWQALGSAPVPEARREPNSDLRTCGTKHIAFSVPDLQGRLKELVKRGVDIAAVQRDPADPMQPDPDPTAPGKSPAFAAFIRDPAGSLIELINRPLPPSK